MLSNRVVEKSKFELRRFPKEGGGVLRYGKFGYLASKDVPHTQTNQIMFIGFTTHTLFVQNWAPLNLTHKMPSSEEVDHLCLTPAMTTLISNLHDFEVRFSF